MVSASLELYAKKVNPFFFGVISQNMLWELTALSTNAHYKGANTK